MKEQHKRFADEYLIDLNGSAAAVRAGFSPTRARQTACDLLNREDIQAYLTERRAELMQKIDISQQRVLEEFRRIALFDIRKLYNEDGAMRPINDLPEEVAAAIASVESYEEQVSDPKADEVVVAGQVRKVKIHNKLGALDSLAKHLGLFEKDNDQKRPVANINIEL